MPGNLVTVNNCDEMEWYVGDSMLDAVVGVLDAMGTRLHDGEPWVQCDSDVAEQFRLRTVFSGGEWGAWKEMPEDLKGRRLYNGFAHMVEHRCRIDPQTRGEHR